MAETDDGGTYEVFVDENGNAWAGDQLIVIEGETGSLTTPPAGITKGPPATKKDGVYQFSTTDMPTIDGGLGGGTFPGSGGDIGKIEQILNGIKNIDWGTLKSVGSFFKDNAGTIISGVALYSSMKSDDTQGDILEEQLGASREALAAWREDRGESKEARKTLYDALDNRMKQGAPPALMPGKVAYANPYQNVVKIGRGAEGSGSPESGPGATLGDAIRSTFTDRHPNAPPQQFIQQHPDRFARPDGPSTWENQGGPPPQAGDQSGRPDQTWSATPDDKYRHVNETQWDNGSDGMQPWDPYGESSEEARARIVEDHEAWLRSTAQAGGFEEAYDNATDISTLTPEQQVAIWEKRSPRTRQPPNLTPRTDGTNPHDVSSLLAMALQQQNGIGRRPSARPVKGRRR